MLLPLPRNKISAACSGGIVNNPACKAACMNHAEFTAKNGTPIRIPNECSNYLHAYYQVYTESEQ